MGMVVWTAVTVPLSVSFGTPRTLIWDAADHIMTALFGVDLLVNFRTAFYNHQVRWRAWEERRARACTERQGPCVQAVVFPDAGSLLLNGCLSRAARLCCRASLFATRRPLPRTTWCGISKLVQALKCLCCTWPCPKQRPSSGHRSVSHPA